MKKLMILILTIGLATVLVACGDDEDTEENAETNSESEEQVSQNLEVTEEEKVAEDEVVAKINGEEITGHQYNPVYIQTKMYMANYGLDPNDKELVKEQTLNELVAQVLIRQEAKNKGIEVTEEEVQEELNVYKEENEDGYNSYLEQLQITDEEFREQVNFTLMYNKYVDQELTVEDITEEEIKQTYDQLKEENEDIMEFEEAQAILKENLMQQKQTELLQAKIEELKENASIETLL